MHPSNRRPAGGSSITIRSGGGGGVASAAGATVIISGSIIHGHGIIQQLHLVGGDGVGEPGLGVGHEAGAEAHHEDAELGLAERAVAVGVALAHHGGRVGVRHPGPAQRRRRAAPQAVGRDGAPLPVRQQPEPRAQLRQQPRHAQPLAHHRQQVLVLLASAAGAGPARGRRHALLGYCPQLASYLLPCGASATAGRGGGGGVGGGGSFGLGVGVELFWMLAWVDMGVVAATFLTAEVGGTAEDGRGSLARG
jgi:hypothetical protein